MRIWLSWCRQLLKRRSRPMLARKRGRPLIGPFLSHMVKCHQLLLYKLPLHAVLLKALLTLHLKYGGRMAFGQQVLLLAFQHDALLRQRLLQLLEAICGVI